MAFGAFRHLYKKVHHITKMQDVNFKPLSTFTYKLLWKRHESKICKLLKNNLIDEMKDYIHSNKHIEYFIKAFK